MAITANVEPWCYNLLNKNCQQIAFFHASTKEHQVPPLRVDTWLVLHQHTQSFFFHCACCQFHPTVAWHLPSLWLSLNWHIISRITKEKSSGKDGGLKWREIIEQEKFLGHTSLLFSFPTTVRQTEQGIHKNAAKESSCCPDIDKSLSRNVGSSDVPYLTISDQCKHTVYQ